MRISRPKVKYNEDSESYFVSMTDIMVGLLFVFVIIIMYFAFQLKIQTEEQDNYANEASRHRSKILHMISAELKSEGVSDVTVDSEQGIIRFPAGVLFKSAAAEIEPNSPAAFVSEKLASAFAIVLRCSVFNARRQVFDWSEECQKQNENKVFVESIFIEGHTDNVPIKGGLKEDYKINNNLKLSARRATNTYEELMKSQPILIKFLSPGEEPVFAASAFGEIRPIESNLTEEGKAANRRIDIRLLMYVPTTSVALSDYKAELNKRLE